MQITLPIKVPLVLHGRGSLNHLRSFVESRIMIVTDKVARDIFGKRVEECLAGKEVVVFDEVTPNPPESVMNKAGDLAKEFRPDLIIGIGGGAALDTAKGAYFLYGQPALKLAQMEYYVDYGLDKTSKLLLIPTTSGTGSESSAGCVFTHEATGMKIDIISADLIPSVVIIDPELTVSMPRSLTIASGVDALAQAIESSMSIFINDFLRALNLSAIKTLFIWLPQAADGGSDDIAVREKVHYAASMVGIAMGNVCLAIGHACGHALGAFHDIPHGITVGVMLPYCIEYNRDQQEHRYREILETLNIVDVEDPTERLSAEVKGFLRKLGVAVCVKDLGISREEWEKNLDTMVKFAIADTCMRTTPRPASEEEMRRLLQCAYEGSPVDF